MDAPIAVKPHVKSVAKSASKTGLNSSSFSISKKNLEMSGLIKIYKFYLYTIHY